MVYDPANLITPRNIGYCQPLQDSIRKTSYRFTAQNTKTVTAIRVSVLSLDGVSPVYRVGIQGDAEGHPSGTYLSSGLFTAVAEWNTVIMETGIQLNAGITYHIVTEYDSGTISIDNRIMLTGGNEKVEYLPFNINNSNINLYDSNLMILYYSDSWKEDSLRKYPVFILDYSDGTHDGQPYNSAYNFSVYGEHFVGEHVLINKENKIINQIGFLVYKVGAPVGDIMYEIRDIPGNTILREGTLATKFEVSGTPAWVDASLLDGDLLLLQDSRYRFILKSIGSENLENSYKLPFTFTKNTPIFLRGLTYDGANSLFCSSVDSGISWSDSPCYDMPFRINKTGGGPTPSSIFIHTGGQCV